MTIVLFCRRIHSLKRKRGQQKKRGYYARERLSEKDNFNNLFTNLLGPL